MRSLTMVLISVLAGVAAGGSVWLTWSILGKLAAARAAKPATEKPQTEKPAAKGASKKPTA
jgi:hypothetical protein